MERVHVKTTKNPLFPASRQKRSTSIKNAANKPLLGCTSKGNKATMVNKHKKVKDEDEIGDVCFSGNQTSSMCLSTNDFRLGFNTRNIRACGLDDETAFMPKPLSESDTFAPEEVLQFLISYFE
mmetsp:Transcript_11115/g.23120  ORF Transcript_11115/g.23120 Transcript_11115/m.23120 type:complete len:124 (+) Transcript_11115:541-912(+)